MLSLFKIAEAAWRDVVELRGDVLYRGRTFKTDACFARLLVFTAVLLLLLLFELYRWLANFVGRLFAGRELTRFLLR